MDMMKKLLCLLAIICVIATVGSVCAADVSGNGNIYIASNNGALQQNNTTNTTNMTINETALFADQCTPYHSDGSSPFAAAGEPTNTTHNGYANNATHTGHTNNTTVSHPAKNAGATSAHTLPSTGNPILILLVTFCGAGSALTLKRRK